MVLQGSIVYPKGCDTPLNVVWVKSAVFGWAAACCITLKKNSFKGNIQIRESKMNDGFWLSTRYLLKKRIIKE